MPKAAFSTYYKRANSFSEQWQWIFDILGDRVVKGDKILSRPDHYSRQAHLLIHTNWQNVFFKDWLQIFLNLGNCCSQKLFGHWQLSSLAEFPAWQCGSGEKCGKSASAHQITRWIKIEILLFCHFFSFCNFFLQINHINYDHYWYYNISSSGVAFLMRSKNRVAKYKIIIYMILYVNIQKI